MESIQLFVASSKQAGGGIPYGDEWYRLLISKLDDASTVVCIFTERSIDRPWILYEAGIAKGKPDTPVMGIAFGIPLERIQVGPFLQFQNLLGDEDSLVKLTMELIAKAGLKPTEAMVRPQVKEFLDKIQPALVELAGGSPSDEGTEEASPGMLFEEIKSMFRELSGRLEKRDDSFRRPSRYREIHPMMIEEMMQMGQFAGDKTLGIVLAASLIREEIPMVYDLALVTYMEYRTATTPSRRDAVMRKFASVLEFIAHGPMWLDRNFENKNARRLIHEFEMALRHNVNLFAEGDEVSKKAK